MATLDELVVRIRADASSLEREMKKAQVVVQQSTGKMGGALATVTAQAKALLPAISAAAVVAFGKNALQAADRLNDLAQRTGVLGSTLSALNIPLLQSGSNIEEFAASINRMNNMVGEAAKGVNQEAVKAFDDLGLSVRKLQQLSPEQQFYEISSALSRMTDQSQMTNSGMAIFGRGFASLIPLIKESGGNLEEFIRLQKESGNALTEAELKKIDEWGDRWTSAIEHAKLSLVQFLDGLSRIGDISNDFGLKAGIRAKVFENERQNAIQHGIPFDADAATKKAFEVANKTSSERPETVNEITFTPSAKGSNKGLIKDPNASKIESARKALADYNTELRRQSEYAALAPAEAAARKAYYDTMELAQKAGAKNAEALAQANEQVARSNEQMNEKMKESARFSAELKDQFAETAKSIFRDAGNAKEALSRLGEALADMLAQRYILGPLSDNLFGSPGSDSGGAFGSIFSSISSMLPSFDVGTPYVPRDMMANIHEGERILTKSENAAYSSGTAGSGGGVTVVQNLHFNDSVRGAARDEIMRAAPAIAAAAKDSVFQAIQQGGSAAKLVGVR